MENETHNSEPGPVADSTATLELLLFGLFVHHNGLTAGLLEPLPGEIIH